MKKFRGYSKELKKWVFGELYKDPQMGYFIIDNKFESRIKVVAGSTGQFTGCYDKDGTPIYVFDIVDWERDNTTKEYASIRTTIYPGCCIFDPLKEETPDNNGRLANVKVIGNYYENEELINNGKRNKI